MDALTSGTESAPRSITKVSEQAPNVVFQPQKLKEVVEIIDLMGNIASRVREDNSGDMGSGSSGTTGQGQQGTTGTSTRDDAIAKAPPFPIMQKKLVHHLEIERKSIERQARAIARSKKEGSAYLLNELYKKLRSLTALISSLLHASAEVIKRFYISVFIDKQPIVVSGGELEGK